MTAASPSPLNQPIEGMSCLPLADITIKRNVRTQHDDKAMQELTDSVARLGVVQPILVRPLKDGYELVAGHRRYAAATAAGLTEIPVAVRELSDLEVLECQLVENLARAGLHPLDEAEGYRTLMAKHKYEVARIAERTGRSVKYVYDRVKLLDLTKEAKALFLEDRFTPGHAILLARLTPAYQATAIERALFDHESLLFGPEGLGEAEEPPKKPISVRELQAWIDRKVRFDAKQIDPMLFPETELALRSSRERAEKIVPITHEFSLSPEVKGDERTLCSRSWKRADGNEGSKPCDLSVTGVIVIGYGRGEAFKVCAAKEKCSIHWGKEIREREKGKKASGGKSPQATQREKWQREEDQRRIERAKAGAQMERWNKASPAIAQAVATRVAEISIAPGGPLDRILLGHVTPYGGAKAATDLVGRGSTAEDLVRCAAFIVLYHGLHEWRAIREFPKVAKALGVDTTKILDEVAPAKEPDPAPAAKASPKKAAKPSKPAKPKRAPKK